ncbi:membrane protein [Arthrobacter phage Argan]|nr:membrane protein [Arthrobacter phage Argan]
MKRIKDSWIEAAEKAGLDPMEGLLWYVTFISMLITLALVFTQGLHWLWPVGFFIALIVEAGVIGNKMEKEGKDGTTGS